jgi:hypothetical protein
MLEPVFERLGPIGVALLFVVLVLVALTPGALDVAARVTANRRAEKAAAWLRAATQRWVDSGRARIRAAVAEGRGWAASTWPW